MTVTVSESVRRELLARGVRRVRVVRPAVDPLFRPAPEAEVNRVRAQHGRYIVFVGWADPRKDVATALAAHRAVAADVPHRLLLIGAGREIFADVPAPRGSTVSVLGNVSDAELCVLLTGAELLLYPSLYEGFGLPPMEAAACGTPSLVSDLPVLRESAQGPATFVPAGVVGAWTAALRRALETPTRVTPPTTRTWNDAARELATLLD
jgi:glycosyltransferase involved in cell wall biosynthesis